MKTLLIALLLIISCLQVFFRLAPVARRKWPEDAKPKGVGDHAGLGGFYAVRKTDDPQALETLQNTIRNEPGAKYQEEGGAGYYILRTWFWGFPDVIEAWQKGDHLHVRGHLVFGRSDLGKNKKRVLAWLAKMNL